MVVYLPVNVVRIWVMGLIIEILADFKLKIKYEIFFINVAAFGL